MIGWFSKLEIPLILRDPVINMFIAYYNVNPIEFETDFNSFSTFQNFLTRKLSYSRELSVRELICPCDGIVTSFGSVKNGKIEQIKGVNFTLTGFLGKKPVLRKKNTELYYIVFYLPIEGYHCFHSPANIIFHSVRHFPGHLFKMSPFYFYNIQALPSINERVVFFGSYLKSNREEQFLSFVSIGSLGLGSIKVYYDPVLKTNTRLQDQDARILGYSNLNSFVYEKFIENKFYHKSQFKRDYSWDYVQPINIEKGQEFGHFDLGSTIALIFEEKKGINFTVERGEKVQYGQSFCDV